MKPTRQKKPAKRTFTVHVSITGAAHVTVEATDEQDARRVLWEGEGSDRLTEWEYDEVLSVTEDL